MSVEWEPDTNPNNSPLLDVVLMLFLIAGAVAVIWAVTR